LLRVNYTEPVHFDYWIIRVEMMEVSGYWNLTEKPFEENCDTRFFYYSEDHREALDRMIYIVNDKNMNMGLLTGEVGSGKTITKSVFRDTLPKQDFEVIDFENSNFRFNDIIYDILKRLTFKDPRIDLLSSDDLPDRDDKYLLMRTLKEKLDILTYEEKRHLILLFDEAQQMEDATLDELKNLTNLSTEVQNVVTIFFVGQPELREKIRKLKQVDQRIFLRFHLNNLDFNNTASYIEHRLEVAGRTTPPVFTREAVEAIFRSTLGVPRAINRLCKLALTNGFVQSVEKIQEEDIQIILEDFRRHYG